MGNQWDFAIMTDSAANLSKQVIDQFGLAVLPLTYTVDGVEYKGYERDREVPAAPVYDMMRNQKEIKTSLVNGEETEQIAEELLKAGKDLLYVGLSSALSGTCQVVRFTLTELGETYPDRQIFVIDSLSASVGEGLLVQHAARLREEGCSIRETAAWLEQNCVRVCHEFTVEDLFYLKRGGRIGTAAALLGSALKVKPILRMDEEGKLVSGGRARGRKKSLDMLAGQTADTISHPEQQTIYIVHGDCREDAEYLADRIRQGIPVKDIQIQMLEPVLGSHSGPGTVGVVYMGMHR